MSDESNPSDRVLAAQAAIAERAHLLEVRKLLAEDIKSEEGRVQQLAKELRFEIADVEKLTTGVMGFLQHILVDENQLAKEKREVVEAQARLREAQGSLESVRAQATDVDNRIAKLVPADLERELADARNARAESLMRGGGEIGSKLQDIGIRIESIDIELVPLGEAVAAGEAAFLAIRAILAALDTGKIEDKAKALAGEAQAKMIGFQRALQNVATASFADPLDLDPADTMFADGWVKALFAKRLPDERLRDAKASMVARIERVNSVLTPLRARRDELAGRRKGLVDERTKALEV